MHLSQLSQLGHPKQMWHFKASGHSQNQLGDTREQEISVELLALTKKNLQRNTALYLNFLYVCKKTPLL